MKVDFFKKPHIFLMGVLLIISFIFLPTINRDWQMFDEKDIYCNEGLYPIPESFSEIPEVISTYAFNFNFESQNLQFSNIVNIRSNPAGAILNILISFFFKKNPVYYHLLSVCIHIFNTALVWLIFYRICNIQTLSENYNYVLSSIITLIWALHPVNIEPVMMSTNWNSIFTYSLYLSFILYTLKKISTGNFQNSKMETVALSLLFFLSVLIVEYSYIFPLVIFFIAFTFSYKHYASIQQDLRKKASSGMYPERRVPFRAGKERMGTMPCELCVSPTVVIVNDFKKLSEKSKSDILWLKSTSAKNYFLSETGTISLISDGNKIYLTTSE
jgi:magnesium-transporting ATPase (P-type)